MGAVSMMARAEVRRRRGVAAMGVLIGLAGAFALTAGIGAKRAATSWDRFAAGTDSPDAIVTAPSLGAARETLAVAKATAGVAAATGLHWLPVEPAGVDANRAASFVWMDDSVGRTIYRPRLLAGRRADQSRPGEIEINQALAELADLHVGDHRATVALGPGYAPTTAVDQDLVVVGIVEGTVDLGPETGNPVTYLTAAFRDRWLPTVFATADPDNVSGGQIDVPILVKAARGADPQTVTDAVVAASPPGTSATVGVFGPNVETTIGYATWSLAILAIVAAVAAVVVGAQAMSRLVQPLPAEEQAWGALGATSRDRTLALAAPPLAAAGVAVVVATVGAVLASPLVPIGFPRRIEIDPGIWIDSAILAGGVILFAAVLTATAVLFAGLARRRASDRVLAASPPWLGIGSPARSLGVRAALGRGTTATSRRRARSAIAAAVVGVLGIAAVAVVVSSSQAALDSPRAWGYGFDRMVSLLDTLAVVDPAALEAAVSADPAVGGLSRVAIGEGTLGDATIELQEIEPRRGSALPVLLSGRVPYAPDEMVIGPLALRDHHLHVGDAVSLTDGGPPVRIVGTAAIPPQEGGEFGFVAWLGAAAFDRLGIDASGQYLYVTVAPGASTDQIDRIIAGDRPTDELDQFSGLGGPSPPPNFANLRQIGGLPYLLAAFLGLLGLASLVHALLIAVRARRRDLAVLRSLGFVRGQVVSTIAWQATTTTLVGITVGVPAGLVVGSWVWRRLASSLGTGSGISVPVAVLAAVAAATLLAAYVIALVPARYASHLQPADVLRTE